jgi:hypothetical protein
MPRHFKPENLLMPPENLLEAPVRNLHPTPMGTWFDIYATLDWPAVIPVGLATTPISMLRERV